MGFWLFTLACGLLIPLTMLGFGRYFQKTGGPRAINMLFGYRTPMSTKNRETWEFAHRYFGKLWYRLGAGLLPASLAALLAVAGQDTETISLTTGILTGVQLFFLLLPIAFTEAALRRTFDKRGNRKTGSPS